LSIGNAEYENIQQKWKMFPAFPIEFFSATLPTMSMHNKLLMVASVSQLEGMEQFPMDVGNEVNQK
jgi:hypothetical protein